MKGHEALSRRALVVLLALALGVPAAAQDGPSSTEGGVDPSAPIAGTAATGSAQASTDAGFLNAVAAYRVGDYPGALSLFAKLAGSEPDAGRRAVLHGNAGTAAARAQRMGEAVWHLEAALRLSPRDAVARRNLTLVRSRLNQGGSEASQFTTGLLRAPLALTPGETQTLLSILAALAVLLLAGWRAGKLGRGAGWTALSLLILCAAWWLAAERARELDASRAVVIGPVAVRAEPEMGGGVLFRLEPGTVVSDEEVRGDWRLVETEGGARGWAPAPRVLAAGG